MSEKKPNNMEEEKLKNEGTQSNVDDETEKKGTNDSVAVEPKDVVGTKIPDDLGIKNDGIEKKRRDDQVAVEPKDVAGNGIGGKKDQVAVEPLVGTDIGGNMDDLGIKKGVDETKIGGNVDDLGMQSNETESYLVENHKRKNKKSAEFKIAGVKTREGEDFGPCQLNQQREIDDDAGTIGKNPCPFPLCNARFDTQQQLTGHKRKYHPKKGSEEFKLAMKSKKLKCRKCFAEFSNSIKYANHCKELNHTKDADS